MDLRFNGVCLLVFVCCFGVCCLFGGLSRPASAQTSGHAGQASQQRTLSAVLLDLQARAGIDLVYDAALIEGVLIPTVALANRSAQAILDEALHGTGLYSYRLSTGTYAIKAIPPPSAGTGSVAGHVHDASTGLPVEDAHVLVHTGLLPGAATDGVGRFSIPRLAPGEYLVSVSHVAYAARLDTVVVLPGSASDVTLRLAPRPITIAPIIVEGLQAPDRLAFLGDAWTTDGAPPTLGFGTPDAMRGVGTLMGVRSGDASADLHIQGGEAGEHQFRLDGVPVFEPVHLRGLLGAFNPFALRRITVHKAGFGAAEGSQIAGVIEAEHALTSPEGRTLDVQVDPLSVNGRLTMRLPQTASLQGQAMAAARASLWEVYSPERLDTLFQRWNAPDPFLLRASLLAAKEFGRPTADIEPLVPSAVDSTLATPDLGFFDVHAAGRLTSSEGRSLYGSFYRGRNTLQAQRFFQTAEADSLLPSEDAYAWGNTNAQIRYGQLLSRQTYGSVQVRRSAYDLEHRYVTINNEKSIGIPGIDVAIVAGLKTADDGNGISEWAVESTVEHSGRYVDATYGVEVARTGYRFNVVDVFLTPLAQSDTTWHAATFAEHEVRLGNATFTPGLRLTYLNTHNTVFAEPRLQARVDVATGQTSSLSVRLAGGLYRQYVNQFDISSVSPSALVPGVRFWMPVDASVRPPLAYHAAADALWQVGPRWAVRWEQYFKDQPHILTVDYPALFERGLDAPDDAQDAGRPQGAFLRSTEGRSYGTALAIERTGPRLRSALRYEFNHARRDYPFQVDTTVVMRSEPVPWNEPHMVGLVLDWLPVENAIGTLRWRTGWDRAWAYRRAYYDFLATNPSARSRYGCDPDETVCSVDLTQPSTHRLPTFSQLDLGAAYTWPLGTTALQFRLDVLNVLDRDNVADVRIEASEANDGELRYENTVPRTALPRTISVALRVRW